MCKFLIAISLGVSIDAFGKRLTPSGLASVITAYTASSFRKQ